MLKQLKTAGVKVVVNAKDPEELDGYMRLESRKALSTLMHIDVQIIYSKNHHRKIAILDRNITWEGSLNILSQNNNSEIMRRTMSASHAWQLVRFIGLAYRGLYNVRYTFRACSAFLLYYMIPVVILCYTSDSNIRIRVFKPPSYSWGFAPFALKCYIGAF